MTHKQMADQVMAWLGLQDITVLDESVLVDQLLYQGTIDLLSRTKCIARCIELRTDAGVDIYTLDHSLLALVDVENGWRPKVRRDQARYTPNFTMIRGDILRLEPPPEDDGVMVQTWAVLRPNQMVGPDDSPGDEEFGAIPEEWQDAIVTYALWKASDYADDVSSQQGERYRILYEGSDGNGGRIQQIKIAVNTRGTSRAPKARVLLRRQRSHRSWVG